MIDYLKKWMHYRRLLKAAEEIADGEHEHGGPDQISRAFAGGYRVSAPAWELMRREVPGPSVRAAVDGA